jgi:hypothetical protein
MRKDIPDWMRGTDGTLLKLKLDNNGDIVGAHGLGKDGIQRSMSFSDTDSWSSVEFFEQGQKYLQAWVFWVQHEYTYGVNQKYTITDVGVYLAGKHNAASYVVHGPFTSNRDAAANGGADPASPYHPFVEELYSYSKPTPSGVTLWQVNQITRSFYNVDTQDFSDIQDLQVDAVSSWNPMDPKAKLKHWTSQNPYTMTDVRPEVLFNSEFTRASYFKPLLDSDAMRVSSTRLGFVLVKLPPKMAKNVAGDLINGCLIWGGMGATVGLAGGPGTAVAAGIGGCLAAALYSMVSVANQYGYDDSAALGADGAGDGGGAGGGGGGAACEAEFQSCPPKKKRME